MASESKKLISYKKRIIDWSGNYFYLVRRGVAMLRAFTLNNVTRVSPGQAAVAPYSCCVIFLHGFSSLLREVFLQLLRVFPLPKNQYFQLKILKDFLHDNFKVARYSFSRSIPPKFELKLRRHKQSFGKITTTVVLDKDENLLWSGCNGIRVVIATKWRYYLFYS